MRVLISVDMEGLAGVVTGTDVSPGEIDYERNRHLMTNEASAAVRGAHAFSADIETTLHQHPARRVGRKGPSGPR